MIDPFDSFCDELKKRRKNMSDPLKDDYYDGRSGSDKIQMPGASDQDAYDMLRKVATQLDRWVIKSCSKDQMLGLANEIYTFLGKKGQ